MTNSKVRNLDSAYSICFSQVLLEQAAALACAAPNTLQTLRVQTNKQT